MSSNAADDYISITINFAFALSAYSFEGGSTILLSSNKTNLTSGITYTYPINTIWILVVPLPQYNYDTQFSMTYSIVSPSLTASGSEATVSLTVGLESW